jgi:IS4 transposase
MAAGLIDERPEASVDATGLDSQYVSRHFLMRQGKRTHRYRSWTKLTIVCHNFSHLIPAAVVSVGPDNDAPYFTPALRQAMEHLPIDRLLGDAAYDSEEHHRLCRQDLGIRFTAIPINDRGRPGLPSTRYRRQMAQRFPKRRYRQRWQVESVFSRMKRRLGSALRSRRNESRGIECLFRVLTYNLMILLFTCYG